MKTAKAAPAASTLAESGMAARQPIRPGAMTSASTPLNAVLIRTGLASTRPAVRPSSIWGGQARQRDHGCVDIRQPGEGQQDGDAGIAEPLGCPT